MQKIRIEKARFYAYHGCMAEEAKIGGEYHINLSVEGDYTTAMQEDDLRKTADYVKLYAILKEEMSIRSKLIEHVAARIMKRIDAECPEVKKAKLELQKLSPPIGGDVGFVSIEVEENFVR